MPTDFPNIDRSGFHRGQYVGYASGAVYRIRRNEGERGRWNAVWHTGSMVRPDFFWHSCKGLGAMSDWLERVELAPGR